ncbi:phage tail-collar fiber domain-containing protein [Vibrio parahaemolyticus]|uniref:phage tail-collar fiber domain-containing protein n=1 Tax=Vibrio parahaemolyticus TaxID=670 RepID=UPI000415A85C|nr:phage tail protein [Vibrio parahaemolyticus]
MANSTDKSILTAAGKALLAQLNAEEKALVIDKMIFANVPNRPEYPQPDDVVPTDHIVHQEQVEQRGRLSADSVIYSTTLTSDVGPFDFNWTGAYCSEYGVLVTIDHHALTPKTADEPGVAGNTLVRSVVLEYKDIAEITNITVDASSWQYNATERMKKMDSDVAQSIIDQNGKDWFLEDGFLVTPSGSAYSIKAGAGYVSGNRVAMEFDRSVQVPNKPSFIYIDAHREGTPTGEQVTLFNFVVTAEEKDDYIDSSTGKDVKHFVCKIAQVLADGSVSDLRPEGEQIKSDTEIVAEGTANGFNLSKWMLRKGVSPFQFGAKGYPHDDTEAIKKCVTYLQNDVWIDPDKIYSHSELQLMQRKANEKTGRPRVLLLDGLFKYRKQLIVMGGFEISHDNSYGAWGNLNDSVGLYYEKSTDNDIALSTAYFLNDSDNRIPVTSFSQVKNLSDDIENIRENATNYSKNLKWEFQLGCSLGTAIGMLFTATVSKLPESRIGMIDNYPDIGVIGINTWKTKYGDCHWYAGRQSYAMLRCNASCILDNIYGTTVGTSGKHLTPIKSTITDWTDVALPAYHSWSDVQINALQTECRGHTHHVVFDNNSKATLVGGYYETHEPSQGTKAAISCYNNSMVTGIGGFLPKSNSKGIDLYVENCDSGRPSTLISQFWYSSSGFLVKTVNSSADIYIKSVGKGGEDNWGRFLTDGDGTTDLSKLHVDAVTPNTISLKPSLRYIALSTGRTFKECLELCRIHQVDSITLEEDVTLDDNIDLNEHHSDLLTINLNGFKLECGTYRFDASNNKKIRQVRVSGPSQSEVVLPDSYFLNAGGQSRMDLTFDGIKVTGEGMLWGNYRNIITGSIINIHNCNLDDFTSSSYAGTPASAGSQDCITVYCNTHKASVTTPILNMNNGNFYS